jgi:hypothetical protein
LLCISYETLTARLVAATLLGWQITTRASGLRLRMYCGTCVDLPQPVLPLMTTAAALSISPMIYSSYLAIGNFPGDNYLSI